MKFLLYSDLHVNHGKASYTTFVEKTVDFLRDLILEHKPDVLVNLGDTVDTFGTLNVKDAVLARNMIRKLTDAMGERPHYVMRGNHDTGDKHGKDTWTDVWDMDGVEIVNETAVYQILGRNFLFVPYTHDFDMAHFAVSCHLAGVFTHTDWIGCRLTPQHVSTSGFVPAEVEKQLPGVRVFSGHYHNPMEAGPVWFVGSPLYKTFNDPVEDIPRGFTLWDTDGTADTPQRITNPNTYFCESITCDTAAELKRARKELGDLAERTRLRVVTKRRLVEKAEEVFEDCLWLGVTTHDNEKTEVEFGTKVALQATPMEIVDQASAIAPEDLDRELVKNCGKRAFHVT